MFNRVTTSGLALAAGLVGVLPAASAQTVYRCNDGASGVVFQQSPCAAAGGQRIDVQPGNVISGQPGGDVMLRQQARRQALIDAALSRGEVVDGMTLAEVRQVLGDPVAVSTTTSGGSTRQHLVYRYSDGSTRRVHIGPGGVYALQEHELTQPTRSRPCHSELEIRNVETSASSITIDEAQRRRLRRQVDEMKGCRR